MSGKGKERVSVVIIYMVRKKVGGRRCLKRSKKSELRKEMDLLILSLIVAKFVLFMLLFMVVGSCWQW